MEEQLKSNLTSSKLWVRMVYMVLIGFFCHIASFIVVILVLAQCGIGLITGSSNQKLKEFGYSLALYIHQGLLFLSFNSEHKPFPFSDWPVNNELSDNAAVASQEESNSQVVSSEVDSSKPAGVDAVLVKNKDQQEEDFDDVITLKEEAIHIIDEDGATKIHESEGTDSSK